MNTYFAKFMTTVCTAALIFPASVFANPNSNPQEKMAHVTQKIERTSQGLNNQGMHFSLSNSLLASDEIHADQVSKGVQSGKMKTLYTLLPYDAELGAQLGVKVSSLNSSEAGQVLQIELMQYDSRQGKLLSFEQKISRAIPVDYETADATQIKLLIDHSSRAMYKTAQNRVASAMSPSQKAKAKVFALGNSISKLILPTANAMPQMPGMEKLAMAVAFSGVGLIAAGAGAILVVTGLKYAGGSSKPIGKMVIFFAAVAVAGLIIDLCVSPYLSNAQYGSDDKDNE